MQVKRKFFSCDVVFVNMLIYKSKIIIKLGNKQTIMKENQIIK